MFSGIVEEIGIIRDIKSSFQGLGLLIQAKETFLGTKLGDSIAVNGTCLTVVDIKADSFAFDVIPETLDKTNLSKLLLGNKVNLERALSSQMRIGGHMVQGHVDTTCNLIDWQQDSNGCYGIFTLPPNYETLIIKKGFVTLDGMSLTVADCHVSSISSVQDGEDQSRKTSLKNIKEKSNQPQNWFKVAFIPHTINHTIVQFYETNQIINLEVDILGKYVLNFLQNTNFMHTFRGI